MAILQTLTNSFKVDLFSGGMNFNSANRALTLNTQDVFKVALYTSTADLGAETTAYTTTGEVSTGLGYTAGGQTLVISQVPTTGSSTTVYVNFNDAVWTSATFSAAGALIYNSSNANRSVAVLSFGATRTGTGTFRVQFPPVGPLTSIVRVT